VANNPDSEPVSVPGEGSQQSQHRASSPGETETSTSSDAVTRGELADRVRKSDRWMIGLTAAIAIGGIVSAVIFGFQLHEMKVAADLTKESIDISIKVEKP
jgi:hypothetical protein